jgi:hypothetical protein
MGDVGPGCDEGLGSIANVLDGLGGDASVAEVRGLVVSGLSEERQEGGEDGEDAHGESGSERMSMNECERGERVGRTGAR